MTGSQGRKSPTADQTIDDWFDLLDEDESISGPVPQGSGAREGGLEGPAEVTLGEAVFEAAPEQFESPDTWDWELSLSDGTPAASMPPPGPAPVQETASFEVSLSSFETPSLAAPLDPAPAADASMSGLADLLEPGEAPAQPEPEPEPEAPLFVAGPTQPDPDEFDDFSLDTPLPAAPVASPQGPESPVDDPFAEPPLAPPVVARPPSERDRAPALSSELEAVFAPTPSAPEPFRPNLAAPRDPPLSNPSFPAMPGVDAMPKEPTPLARNTPAPSMPPSLWTPRPRVPPTGNDQPTPVPPPRHVVDPDELQFEDSDSLQFDPERAAPTSPPSALKPTPVMTFLDPEGARPTPMIPAAVPPEAMASLQPPMLRGEDLTPLPHEAPNELTNRKEMHERLELGDFTGALSLADALITVDPLNEDAQKVADTCRARLRAIYLGRIGALDQVPAMVIPSTEIRWLALDHRAGFVLSLVDGVSTIEEIIDVSSMEPLEVLRTLYNLITQNVITLRRPRR